MALLILAIDRDDDIGTKTGLSTPIFGRDECLKAGTLLLLSDPEDSDGNTIFAAVSIYDKLSKERDVDVAVVSGDARLGLLADEKIRKQVQELLSKKKYEGVILVTDGAEDDQVIPVISSMVPIISKKTVVVRQSQALESAYYTIKTALQEPAFARLFLGIPGLLLFLWFLLQENATRLISGVLGLYLILRGFGLEEPLLNAIKSILSVDPNSPSLPFHILSVLVFLAASSLSLHLLKIGEWLEATRMVLFGGVVASFVLVLGKSLEAISKREGYRLGDLLIFFSTVLVLGIFADLFINFMKGLVTPYSAAVVVLVTSLFYLGALHLSRALRIGPVKGAIGVLLFDRSGRPLGRIEKIKDRSVVLEGRKKREIPIDRIKIVDRRLVA